jgi:hypothetical protein
MISEMTAVLGAPRLGALQAAVPISTVKHKTAATLLRFIFTSRFQFVMSLTRNYALADSYLQQKSHRRPIRTSGRLLVQD